MSALGHMKPISSDLLETLVKGGETGWTPNDLKPKLRPRIARSRMIN